MMQLANNWKIKLDNQFWLVLENDIEPIELIFSKQLYYVRIDPIVEEYNEDNCSVALNENELIMCLEILKELRGSTNVA